MIPPDSFHPLDERLQLTDQGLIAREVITRLWGTQDLNMGNTGGSHTNHRVPVQSDEFKQRRVLH